MTANNNLSLALLADIVGGKLTPPEAQGMVQGVSTDTREISAGMVFWALEGENFDGHQFCHEAYQKGGIAVVIRSEQLPGLEIPTIRVPDTLYALGELAGYLRRQARTKVIGITGSVGKTTTKEFVRHALQQQFQTCGTEGNLNNLIGVPKTILQLMEQDESTAADYMVVEMGIDRPGEMDRLAEIAQPDHGVITHISEVHLERMGSVDGVLKEKGKLLEALPPQGQATIPADLPCSEQLRKKTSATVNTFGVNCPADYVAVELDLMTSGCYGFTLQSPQGSGRVALRVPGEQMVRAATAAAAVALSQGVSLSNTIEGLQRYAGLPGRCEVIELNGKITLIADHYNANPVSMRAGLRLLQTFQERRRVFVAGDMLDLGPRSAEFHHRLGTDIAQYGVDLLATVGPQGQQVREGAISAGMSAERVYHYPTTPAAAEGFIKHLQQGDVVLIKGSRGMHLEKVIDAAIQYIGRNAKGEN